MVPSPAALALVLGLASLLAQPAPGAAQAEPQPSRAAGSAALSSSTRHELRQDIERLYQVTGVHNGVLLRPRVVRQGVREVEVSGDSVLINGAHVVPQVVREWLRDEGDATQVLRLLDLTPADRQALFGLPRDVAATSLPPEAPRGSTGAPGAAAGGGREGGAEPGHGAAGQAQPPAPPTPPEAPERPEAPEAPEAPVPPLPPMPPMPPVPGVRPAPPAVSSGSRVRFGGPVTVEKNEVAEEVFTIGGSVHVDGEVNRDVSAVGGSVRVNGRVGGNVFAIGGSVHLGPHAEVMGDVSAVGGTVIRDPGAVIHGNLSDVSKVTPWGGGDNDWENGWQLLVPFGRSLHLFWSLATLVLLLLAVMLVVLLAPRALEQVRERIAGEPWTVLAAGVLGEILAAPALVTLTVVLVLSIVGCLLLIFVPVLILALMIAALVGFAGVGYQVGRMLEGRFSGRFGGPYLTTLVGVVAIEAPMILSHLFPTGIGFLHLFAAMFWLFGLLLRYLAWTVGFGAAILTAFANRPQRFRRQAPPGPVAPVGPPHPAAALGAPPPAAP